MFIWYVPDDWYCIRCTCRYLVFFCLVVNVAAQICLVGIYQVCAIRVGEYGVAICGSIALYGIYVFYFIYESCFFRSSCFLGGVFVVLVPVTLAPDFTTLRSFVTSVFLSHCLST